MAGNTGTGSDLDREGIPDLETPINQDEGMIAPGDYPKGADEFGVTAREERLDEPLSERVAREVRDVGPDDIDLAMAEAGEPGDRLGAATTGRLVEPGDEDVDVIDDEKDVIGTLIGDDDGALSAEEQAMHITDSP